MIARVKQSIGSILRGFTMIELVIALVVIIVAVLSIMVLFPIGMEANRSAMGRSSAYSAVEQFLHLTSTRIRHDWDLVDAFPDSAKPFTEGDPAYRVWSTKSLANSQYVRILWYVNSGNAGDDFDPQVHNTGLFRVDRLNTSGGVDFSVIVRAWKEVVDYGDGSDASAKSVSLNAEVSWPVDYPYVRREKSVFQSVLFNPGEVSNLVVEIRDDYIYESQDADTDATIGTVTRVFGDLASPLTINLATSDDTEAVPSVNSVTIAAGQSTATFGIRAVDDSLTDGRQLVTLTASDPNYPADERAYRPGRDSVSVIDDETPELRVVVVEDSISENGGLSDASVIRMGDNAALPLTVFIVSRDRLEAIPNPSPIVLAGGQTSATFQVQGVDDNLLDGNKTVEITAAAKGYAAVPDSIVVTDYETLIVAVTPAQVIESAGADAAVGTVTRSNSNVGNSLSVSLSSSDGSSIGVPASVVIPAGAQFVTFAVDAIDDNRSEPAQTVVQIHASASGYVEMPGQITVIDDEGLSLAIAAGSIAENAGATTGVVTRNVDNPDEALVVSLASSDSGEAASPGTVTIPAGALSASFAISAADDNILDGSQTVTFTASAGGYASATANLVVTDHETLVVAILHDAVMETAANPATTATVTRSNSDPADPAFNQPIRVNLTNGDESELTLPLTVLIPAGQAAATFSISVVNDHQFDGDQTVTVAATATGYDSIGDTLIVMDASLEVAINPSTIYESAAAGVTTATGTVRRGRTGVAIQLNLVSSDTTEATVSPASISFAADVATASFQVLAQNDNETDGNQNVIVTAYGSDLSGQASVTVADDDKLVLTVALNPDSFSEDGGANSSTGTVSIPAAVGQDLVITLASNDTSEVTVPATVTIPAGQTSITFAVAAVDDSVVDGTQTATLIASATGYADGSASATVTDDDAATLTVSIAPDTFGEDAGASASVGTITRNSDTTADLVVTLASSDASEATVPISVTIPAGQSSATFAVAAVDDDSLDGDQVVIITATAASHTDGTATVTVTDGDTASLTVSLEPDSFPEDAGANASIGTVVRNSSFAGPLSVSLSSSDTSEATVPTSVTIPAGYDFVTFAVAAVNDNSEDGDQEVTITATATSHSDGTAIATVTDNDGIKYLTVTLSPATFGETAGSTASKATIRRYNYSKSTVTVSLSSSDTSEATVPATVTFAYSKSTATFWVAAVDDTYADGEQFVTITASASSYRDGNDIATVTDNEGAAALTVTLNPDTFAEDAGANASVGVVYRNSDPDTTLVVSLSSSDTSEATVPATVTLAPGITSATFPIAAVNDGVADGDQQVTITATVANHSDGTAVATVTDVTVAGVLTVTLNPDRIEQGSGNGASTGTVTRDTDPANSLIASLTSSDPANAAVPATVTFAPGSSSVTFSVDAPAAAGSTVQNVGNAPQTNPASGIGVSAATDPNELEVTITASAANHQDGKDTLAVWWTVDPPVTCSEVSGEININPNNSGKPMEFYVVRGDGSSFGRDDLFEHDPPIFNNGVYYSGSASLVRVKPKSNHNTLIVDGEPFPLHNGTVYTFTGDDLEVTVYNDHVKNGKAMGQWYLSMTGCVDIDDGSDDDGDDTTPELTVTVAPDTITETAGAGAAVGTVTRDAATATALTVTLHCDDTTEASVDATVTIPANQASVTFAVAAVDDTLVDGDQTVTITASATGHYDGSATATVTDNEAAAVTLTVNPDSFAETAGANASAGTVTRNTDTTDALTVNLTSSDTTEATVSASVTIPAGASSATFAIAAVDDSMADGDQQVTVTAAAAGHVDGTATLTVTDNEVAALTVTLNPDSFWEEAGPNASVGTVTRNSSTTAALTVSLTSSDTTEATVPASVTIPIGQSSATFAIAAVHDDDVDGDQQATLTAAASGHTNGSAIATITDADANGDGGDQPPTLTVTLNPSTFAENAGAAASTGTVTISRVLAAALTVSLTSSDTTEATVPGTVTIGANQASVTFAIGAVNDGTVDGDQTSTIAANAANCTGGQAIATITDVGLPALTVTLNQSSIAEDAGANAAVGTVSIPGATSQNLAVSLVSNDTTEATVPTTVTISAGQTSATFAVAAVDDTYVDGTQTVTISASATGYTGGLTTLVVTDSEGTASLTVTLNPATFAEGAGTKASVATVTRNTQPLYALIVSLSSSDTSEATVPSSVTIDDGVVSATFYVAAVDDSSQDGSQDATITASASSHTSGTAVATVLDNDDVASLRIVLSPSTFDEDDGSQAAVATVKRYDYPKNTSVTVSLTSSDTSEATVPSSVYFPSNKSSASFYVTAVDDSIIDGDQYTTITASASNYQTGTVVAEVQDNESPAALTLTINPTSFRESAGDMAAIGTVTRNSSTDSALAVSLASSDPSEATVPASLTIAAGKATATFYIAAVDDAYADGNQDATLTATAANHSDGTVVATIRDNDGSSALAVSVSPNSFSESAGANAAVGTVSRNTEPTAALAVSLASSDTSEADVSASVTIPAGQTSTTFSVNAVDDSEDDGDQSVTVTATAPGHDSGLTTVIVTDDDGDGSVASLLLSVAPDKFNENSGARAAKGTVTRSNTSMDSSLTVALTSSDATEAKVPATVIILANQASVTFYVEAVNDALADGDQTVTLTASSSIGSATQSITVCDTLSPPVSATISFQHLGADAALQSSFWVQINDDAPIMIFASNWDTETVQPTFSADPSDTFRFFIEIYNGGTGFQYGSETSYRHWWSASQSDWFGDNYPNHLSGYYSTAKSKEYGKIRNMSQDGMSFEVGWEDLPGQHSDFDYNDFIIYVDYTPAP